jgi:hypothetical protein
MVTKIAKSTRDIGQKHYWQERFCHRRGLIFIVNDQSHLAIRIYPAKLNAIAVNGGRSQSPHRPEML